MSAPPIAGVMARIASIETRFDVVRTAPPVPGVNGPSRVGAAAAPAGGTPEFGDVFGAVMGQSQLGTVAVPWSQLAGGLTQTASLEQMFPAVTGSTSTASTSTASTPAASSRAMPGLAVGAPSTMPNGVDGPAPVQLEALDARPVAQGTPFAELFNAAGARHGVPPRLLASIGYVESRYQTDVVSPAGAVGVMQLMPFVSEHYGVDPRVPEQAIDAAGQLLAEHFERFDSWELSVASYFSGAGAVSGAGNVPPTERSHDYVRKVTERLQAT